MNLATLTTRAFLLAATAAAVPASPETTNDAGKPVASFVKDLIRVGQYQLSDGSVLDVTTDDMDHWVAEFDRMSKAGVKVPCPLDHSASADANRGYTKRLWRVGNVLWGELELVGRDAIDMAGRTEVSVGIVPEITDGNGEKYANVLEHVALTNYPVVPAQGGFIKLSRDGKTDTVPVYRLSLNAKEPRMEAICKLLGIDPTGKTPEDVEKEMLAKITSMNASLTAGADEMKEKDAALATANATLARLNKGEAKPDPVVLRVVGENRRMKIENRVASGKLTRKGADKLADAWIGKDNSNLSRTIDDENDLRFDAVMAAIDENKPLRPRGNETPAQSMSRANPSDEPGDNEPLINDKLQASRKAALK